MNSLLIVPLPPDSYMLVTVPTPEAVETQKVMTVIEGRSYELKDAVHNWLKAHVDSAKDPESP